MTTRSPDLDGDGQVTVNDFMAFQNLFAAGDLRADFDGNGLLNINDFGAFLNAVAAFSPGGWTPFLPSVDTRAVYVDSAGSDSHDGLSAATAVRTLAAGVAKLRPGMPDWLLLRRGSIWAETLHLEWRKGRSDTERLHIAAYGAGPRPKIGAGSFNGAENIDFTDLDLERSDFAGQAFSGLGVYNILFENCRVRKFSNAVVVAGDNGAPGGARRCRNVKVRRCVLVDAADPGGRASEVLVGETDGFLLEECYLFRGGRGSGHGDGYATGISPSVFSHNVYIDPAGCTNITTRGNMLTYAADNALRYCGAVCENNVLFNNANGIVCSVQTRRIVGNLIDGCIDAAPGVTNGASICNGQLARDAIVSDNIAIRSHATGNVSGWTFTGDYGGLTFTRNITRGWDQSYALNLDGNPTSMCRITDNVFDQGVGTAWHIKRLGSIAPLISFSGNRYRSLRDPAFWVSAGWVSSTGWVMASGETGGRYEIAPMDAIFGVPEYAASLGFASVDDFFAACENQERGNWREDLTAAAVLAWVRARTPAV